MAEASGNDRGPLSPGLSPAEPGTDGTCRRGIVIQLTGTEGEWDSLEDNELFFPLSREGGGSSVPLPKQRSCPDEDWNLHSATFHMPLSPSSPGSLGDLSASLPSFLSPKPATPVPLHKSLSTELELKDSSSISTSSSLKPRPLISLVKSISTELSRSEPEVCQSRSDSKLNLHLLKQLAQPKFRVGDSRTAPPSPTTLSPTEPKASFFRAELEDTRRRLQDAMQEPLSVFSKIMGDDSTSSSPRHKDSPGYRGLYAGLTRSSGDLTASDSPTRGTKRFDCDPNLPVFNWPMRNSRRTGQRTSPSQKPQGRSGDQAPPVEPSAHGQAVPAVLGGGSTVPTMGLCYFTALSYCCLVFPLGTYLSGMVLGLAFGFMMGLLLISLDTSRQDAIRPRPCAVDQFAYRHPCDLQGDLSCLKGWFNETHSYDPELYHPALTHSVHITLAGSSLQMDYPRHSVSRRATTDKPPHGTDVVRSRKCHLTGSKVFLLPAALAKKRVWNQKYPICITLAEGEEAVEEVLEEMQVEEQRDERKSGAQNTLYLFARTGREKEEWFRHFLSASRTSDQDRCGMCACWEIMSGTLQASRGSSKGSEEDLSSITCHHVGDNVLLDYYSYMRALLPSPAPSPTSSPAADSTHSSPTEKNLCSTSPGEQPVWLNVLIGRIFWDFLQEKYWADLVSHKIQKKLSKIRLPHFMNELTLTELDMGSSMPQVMSTYEPQVNPRGLWLQLEVRYTGALKMTLETKINLSKLGKEGALESEGAADAGSAGSWTAVLADSDEESSSAGSSEDEELLLLEPQGILGEKCASPGAEGRTGRKILRLVDKIAKSKYFQKATENEYIRKKMEEMSNTPLLLTVEVLELSGTLVVNVPPPPTDRIWYSFCFPPRLDLRVLPKLGERELTFCHVTEWIEKKLQDEFQKVFVLPNMDDIYLPLMHSGLYPQQEQSCSSPLGPDAVGE
ncbi:testis-expressed protein 2-like isoform X2 [Denticeps clupeoides]|uniref:testis-expressed protein 2-like isoform X2 n=1 Tax=Denticeps clupeoides TaxID=299321 RepID=UPI0010A586C3|nr:testis-expressed protein 2-like isoform X2 [Denticeps clupeoides]XP_028845923.1 testis-expressed protein 2-like isoform X2 [Denticeps clupeoides]